MVIRETLNKVVLYIVLGSTRQHKVCSWSGSSGTVVGTIRKRLSSQPIDLIDFGSSSASQARGWKGKPRMQYLPRWLWLGFWCEYVPT